MSDKVVWHACHQANLRAGIDKPIHPPTLRHSLATHYSVPKLTNRIY